MVTTQASVVVLGIERADFRPLAPALQRVLGEALLADPLVEAAWIAAEDAGTKDERLRLQVAVSDRDGRPGTASSWIWPAVEELQGLHRVRLAIETYRKEGSDIVPSPIAETLGLMTTYNPSVTLHRSFSARSVR